jgi:hypothetical protein
MPLRNNLPAIQLLLETTFQEDIFKYISITEYRSSVEAFVIPTGILINESSLQQHYHIVFDMMNECVLLYSSIVLLPDPP